MRSPGIKGVGYLSFLILDSSFIYDNFSGIFVTVYDTDMNQRECLGEWFSKNNPYSKNKLNNLIKETLYKAKKYSRLTNGKKLGTSLKSYSITYLYEEKTKEFIRGWHGIKYYSFFLPNVFLEHTFNNGEWISKTDKKWPQEFKFNLGQTLNKLREKAVNYTYKLYNRYLNKEYKDFVLYSSQSLHFNI